MVPNEQIPFGGTGLMNLHPLILKEIDKSKIKSICIGTDIAYVTDRSSWTYKFIKKDGLWELDQIRMKRRYGNGRFKTHNGRHHDKPRKH